MRQKSKHVILYKVEKNPNICVCVCVWSRAHIWKYSNITTSNAVDGTAVGCVKIKKHDLCILSGPLICIIRKHKKH